MVRRVFAWGVHLYTASSAVFGLFGVVACFRGQFRLAMYWMMLTMVIDSTDGALARLVDVRGQIPWFDGRRLDDICDYFTYVLLPACFLIAARMLPDPLWAAVPVLASGYGFSQDKAKTDDYFFLGWPSYWNVAVMYLYLLGEPPAIALAWVLGLAAAIFVPLKYIYPSRTRVLRPLSLLVLSAWTLVFSWLAVRPEPSLRGLYLTLALGPGYYVGLSLLLNVPSIRAALEGAGARGAAAS
ncbi:MAG TPA: CDP-diacylglycerol O-phosphatidyltransferase [Myxococcota bacterium]|nr:CDP-diacylglycerol O-phosphatidyltransferase [Myxococcota bacterium]